jgi:uncharacterized protein YndB with AHSA1/START domain
MTPATADHATTIRVEREIAAPPEDVWALVSDAEPGRRFAFDVRVGPFRVARWEYRFEPADGGCVAAETYSDQRGWLVTTVGTWISGVADRAAHNRATMETTLERLGAAAEAAG